MYHFVTEVTFNQKHKVGWFLLRTIGLSDCNWTRTHNHLVVSIDWRKSNEFP